MTISILSLLSGITTAKIGVFVTEAKKVKAQAEFNSLEKAIISAQVLEENTLDNITETTGTMYSCGEAISNGDDLRDPEVYNHEYDGYPSCMAAWRSALLKIGMASNLDVSHFLLDPWGSPYLLDEGGPEECNFNILASAGKNADFSDDTLRIEIYSPYGNPCPDPDDESSGDPYTVTEGDWDALAALFPNFPDPKFPMLGECYFFSDSCRPEVVKCIPRRNRNGCAVSTVNFYEKIGEIPISY